MFLLSLDFLSSNSEFHNSFSDEIAVHVAWLVDIHDLGGEFHRQTFSVGLFVFLCNLVLGVQSDDLDLLGVLGGLNTFDVSNVDSAVARLVQVASGEGIASERRTVKVFLVKRALSFEDHLGQFSRNHH